MAKLAIDVVLNKAAAMTGLRGLEKDVTSFGKSMLGIVGIGGGIAGIVAGIDGILAKAGQLQDVSDAFNVSAESIQRLANVAVTANLSVEEIGSKLGKLGKAAQEAAGGNEKLKEAFAKINVKGQELVSLNPEQLFDRLREAISSGALAGEDLSIVNDLLAKDYQRFLPLLRMTAEEYKNLGNSSAVLSDVTVSNLDAMNVKLRQFQNTISTVAALYMSEWVDLLKDFSENPFATVSDYLNSDFDRYDKRIQERAKKVKEMIQKERASRAGQEKTVQDEKKMEDDKKAFEKSEAAAADHEDRINKGVIAAKNKAEEMKADIEEKYRKQSLDREIEMEKKKNEQKLRLQDLLAKEGGPQAEIGLLESRAQDAAKAFESMRSTETATALAEARGALKDALVQQIKDQPGTAPKGFAENEAQRKLAAGGLAADLSGFAQKSEQFRPLEKLPDMANQLVAASKTLDQILEEIKKGDGSVFR
jgi:hypothetical protein